MKKILIIVIFMFSLISIFPEAYELSVGGSFRPGMGFFYSYHTGYYQNISVPFVFSYYPTKENNFSIGFRNRIGYGLMATDSTKVFNYNAKLFTAITYDKVPVEHEIYENLSFVYKIGRQVKFVHGTGITLKYSFFDIPKAYVTVYSEINNPDMYFMVFEQGLFHYLSLGPTMDINLEIQNYDKNFSFMIGIPVEFLFPTKFVPILLVHTVGLSGDKIVLKDYDIDKFYFNFTFGVEFTFSFNYFKELKQKE